jgi:zinc-binding alcohol dehydrogenase family protein
LPLTAITAWEILFDSLQISQNENESILIIGAAGGVGSILIQLAKKVLNLTVITTASRPETIEWVKKMGADHVIDHNKSLNEQMKTLNIAPKYIASLRGTQTHFTDMVELIKVRGKIALIDDPENINISIMKQKSLSLCWEFMFARPMFNTNDIEKQHTLLNKVAELIDDGTLVSTSTKNLGDLSVATLLKGHSLQANENVIGKNVLNGFKD